MFMYYIIVNLNVCIVLFELKNILILLKSDTFYILWSTGERVYYVLFVMKIHFAKTFPKTYHCNLR